MQVTSNVTRPGIASKPSQNENHESITTRVDGAKVWMRWWPICRSNRKFTVSLEKLPKQIYKTDDCLNSLSKLVWWFEKFIGHRKVEKRFHFKTVSEFNRNATNGSNALPCFWQIGMYWPCFWGIYSILSDTSSGCPRLYCRSFNSGFKTTPASSHCKCTFWFGYETKIWRNRLKI